MADSTTNQMITLRSSDGEEFEVPETVAKQSKTISYLRGNIVNMNYIPLLDVPAPILKMVIEYCEKHDVDAADHASKIETTEEGSTSSTTPTPSSRISDQFVDIDMSTLYDLLMAAKFLRIDGLLDVTIQKMADKEKKSPEETRQYFGIKTDFTPEDKEEVLKIIYQNLLCML